MTTKNVAKDPRFAYTLANGLRILEAFGEGTPYLGNRELSDATGMSKSTVSRFTRTLCDLGYLTATSGKFELGLAVLSLAYPRLINMPIRRVARPLMQELADRVNGAVNLGLRDRLDIVFVESCRKLESVLARPEIGARRPIVSHPLGAIYLASLNKIEREAILKELKPAKPGELSSLKGAVEARVQELATEGFCLTGRSGFSMIASAIKVSQTGQMAIINCTVENSAFPKRRMVAEVFKPFMALTQKVEEALGTHAQRY